MAKNPVAEILFVDGRKVVVELLPQKAPNTVNSFIYLAEKGIYNGWSIQRIVNGYVIDASYCAFKCDEAKYLIKNESRKCGFEKNDIRVDLGVICMGGYENGIAGGEFYFPLDYFAKLDGYYPAFGMIKEGLDIIREIGKVPTKKVNIKGIPFPIDEPCSPVVIKSISIDTFGTEYPEPEKLSAAEIPESWKN